MGMMRLYLLCVFTHFCCATVLPYGLLGWVHVASPEEFTNLGAVNHTITTIPEIKQVEYLLYICKWFSKIKITFCILIFAKMVVYMHATFEKDADASLLAAEIGLKAPCRKIGKVVNFWHPEICHTSVYPTRIHTIENNWTERTWWSRTLVSGLFRVRFRQVPVYLAELKYANNNAYFQQNKPE